AANRSRRVRWSLPRCSSYVVDIRLVVREVRGIAEPRDRLVEAAREAVDAGVLRRPAGETFRFRRVGAETFHFALLGTYAARADCRGPYVLNGRTIVTGVSNER